MTQHARQEYAEAVRTRYQAASKPEKGRMLDEYCRITRCHRKAAIRQLSRPRGPAARRRGRPRCYGPELVPVLERLWELSAHPCGKLLVPLLPVLVSALDRHGELRLAPERRAQLLGMSAATLDRLLQPVRRTSPPPLRGGPPAPTALKRQIPIRSFGEWHGVTPGSLQADLVFHCGERTEGFFLTTLVSVDVATGWTELESIWGTGQQRVGTGVHHVRQRLPFPLRELHTDNGSEFINHVLVPWCRREGIRLTRGRGYRKNDQAYVEQRNWVAVRRQVGYDRYRSPAAHTLFQRLYGLLRLQLNFLRPLRKLVSKQRLGAHAIKRYDAAQTPYQRLLTAGVLTAEQRQALEREFLAINPVTLTRQIARTLDALWKVRDREAPPQRAGLG